MQYQFNGPTVVAAIKARAGEAVKDVARRILAEADANVPEDTGELRESDVVVPDPDDTAAYVIYSAPHAGFVETGTAKMAARPFLQRATMVVKAESSAAFASIVATT